MRLGQTVALAFAGLSLACSAQAADKAALKNLQAPPPAELRPFEGGSKPRPVKFARVVMQLKPEPWAFVRIDAHSEGGDLLPSQEDVVTWDSGRQEIKPPAISSIFEDELRQAGVPVDGAADSLFGEDASADLQVGVKITGMQARFCQYCGLLNRKPKWTGAVVMTAHWELYSSLERKVIASVDTDGGFQTIKDGLEGEPSRLIHEAFRDNVRRLIASSDFRRVVSTSGSQGQVAASPEALTPIALSGPNTLVPTSSASKSVAIVYAADGQGSGFLVSADGYLLTNQHVVGGSKFVKLKWSDGAETLGEVIRADRRRDVALIKTDAQSRAPLSLRTGPVQQGETVFAIGTPLQDRLQNTMTKGIVSAERVEGGLRFIQSDAGVNHGNSGGPLLDDKGAVVAITVSGILPDNNQMGLNFFIPIDDALKTLALTPATTAAGPAPAPAVTPAVKRKG